MRQSRLGLAVAIAMSLWSLDRAIGGELRGRLALGTRPAAGVTVSAVPYEAPHDQAHREARRGTPPAPLAAATTGQDGAFVLKVPTVPGKDLMFTVRAEGGGSVAAAIAGVWDTADNADLGEHVLQPGATLVGKVTDAAGSPLAGTEVTLVAALDPSVDPSLEALPCLTVSGSDGTFRFDGASAAGNTLEAEREGFVPARMAVARPSSPVKPIVLGAGVAVAGTVRSIGGLTPAAGVLVRAESRVTTRWVETGKDGSFTIAHAPAGVATIVADGGEAGVATLSNTRLPLTPGRALTVVLQPAAALIGRTVDAKTARAVPRTRVVLGNGPSRHATRSAADGTYAFGGLPPGVWRLAADEPRFVPWTHNNLELRAGQTTTLDVPLVLGASISGRVTDENGQGVSGAKGMLATASANPLARIMRRQRSADAPAFRTLADGSFTATRLAPGDNQRLTFEHPEFESTTLGGVTLVAGAAKTGVAVVLRRGAVIAGVVKGGDDQPIGGAVVEVARPMGGPGGRGGPMLLSLGAGRGSDQKHDTTAADGGFSLHGLAPGDYALTIKKSGFATARVEPVKVPETGSPKPIEVTLGPGAAISGRVVRRGGAGVEGFAVIAMLPGGPRLGGATMSEQPTGPDGAFEIDGLKPGQSYDLQLFGLGRPTDGKRGVVAPASNLEITVPGVGRIAGTAVDSQSGHFLTDFDVSYEPDRPGMGGGGRMLARSVRSMIGAGGQVVSIHRDDGAFLLEEVPAGTWSVSVTAKGYQPARTGGVVVEEGATRDGVEVRVTPGLTVSGHVTDAKDGHPVANATVTFAAPGASPALAALAALTGDSDLTTDADGRFEADGVAPGKQTIRVTQPDYADATVSVDVKTDSPTVEIHMTAGGVLGGAVVSEAQQPVPGAQVAMAEAGEGGLGRGMLGAGQQAVADGAGRFRFDHLGAGRYTLTASLGSRSTAPADVVLQAGQSQENLVLQLRTGVTIQGTVSGLPDDEVAGTTVTAVGASSFFATSRVGSDARFELDNVPAGPVTLRGAATDATGSTRTTTKQVTATDDQPVLTVDLVFESGYTLSGHLTRAGQPAAGANVVASQQGSGRQASARTDDGGAYHLDGLQAGTYAVSAMATLGGGGSSRRQTISLSSDQTLDLVFPTATLAGQVVDASSKAPLPDASVSLTSQAGSGARFQPPATTDSTGKFSFANLDEGSYTLTVTKPDYQLAKSVATAAESGSDSPTIELTRGSGLSIKVQDGIFQVPLRGVVVLVLDGQNSPVYGPAPITLDDNGQGDIPSLQPGSYNLVVTTSGYATVQLNGIMVPSPTVAIMLTPGGTLVIQAGPQTLGTGTAYGTLVTVSGQPALLSLFNRQGRITLTQPTTRFANVATGSYLLQIPAAQVSQTAAISEGATATVTLP